jgi:hypothetical protein
VPVCLEATSPDQTVKWSLFDNVLNVYTKSASNSVYTPTTTSIKRFFTVFTFQSKNALQQFFFISAFSDLIRTINAVFRMMFLLLFTSDR